MRSVIFVPFGSLSQEAGVLALLARYLNSIYPDVSLLICDGFFSLCDRDAESAWQRDPHSCSRCMNDQRNLATWAQIPVQRLSNYISHQEILDSRRWVLELSGQELLAINYKGIAIGELLAGTFSNRLGVTRPDLSNKNHEQFLRRLSLAALRMCIVTDHFNNRYMPNLSLVASGEDFLSAAFSAQSRQQGCFVSMCTGDLSSRCVRISHPRSSEKFNFEFFLRDLRAMRSDMSTWPDELVVMLGNVLAFLGISDTQLTLPIAR